MAEQTIIPVQVRAARTEHACGQCCKPILPGQRYEDHRLPPRREPNDGDHWWPMKIHAPRSRNGNHNYGCDMAAAYREKAARERAAAIARAGQVPIGTDLELLCDAARVVITRQHASQILIQRKVRVGFAKACRLLILLEHYGVTGPPATPPQEARDVLVMPQDLVSVVSQIRFIHEGEPASA